jgi:rod shape-determining protein MreC
MLFFVIASVTLMTIDHRWNSLEMVRSGLSSIVYPLQYTIDLPIRLYYWADEVLSTKQTLLEKNRQFEARHLENRVQLQKLDIIEKENERLRKLLSATPKSTERLLIAELINVDVDPYRQLIVLNKGLNNDVYQGQPIIDASGIFGQVVHVAPLSSTAILITDASHAIPVQVDRTGLRANAFGTGKIDQLELRYLPHNVDILPGDMLISSGLGGTFPPNYPIAVVTKVERAPGEPFATVEAAPMAQLDKSREVLLVWRNTPEPEDKVVDEENKEADEDSAEDEKPEDEKSEAEAGAEESSGAEDSSTEESGSEVNNTESTTKDDSETENKTPEGEVDE